MAERPDCVGGSLPSLHEGDFQTVIQELVSNGYQIALYNPTPENLPHDRPDARVYSMFALDADNNENISDLTTKYARGGHLRMMVRELETVDQYDRFRDLNFDLFEGQFFARPRLLHGTEIPGDRIGVLALISRLQDPDVQINEIESLVSRDVALSYKLLRLINAAFYGLPKKTDSIRRAVMFFGLERVRNWATVLLVNSLEFRPRELLSMAMIRARTCQLLAEDMGYSASEPYYVAGLFSLLDAIMDAPMATILERLNLVQELNEALLRGTGRYGEVLNAVLALERGAKDSHAHLTFTSPDTPMRAYLEGIRWAREFDRQVRGQLSR